MKSLIDLMVLVFVVSTVLGAGLDLTVSQVVSPLRKVRVVVLAVVVNFLVVPASALAIAKLMSLDEAQSIGLILVGAAAGAPFLSKVVELAAGDLALSVALMVLLMLGSLVYLPLVLPILIPGITVDSWKIARALLITMILPLAIGLAIKAVRSSWAVVLRPACDRLGRISLLAALVLIVYANSRGLGQIMMSAAIPATILLIAFSYGAGYLAGMADGSGDTLALGTSARNFPAALIIAGQNFKDPNVVMTVIAIAIVTLVVLVPVALSLRRRNCEKRTVVV